jgi:hypothetical protein
MRVSRVSAAVTDTDAVLLGVTAFLSLPDALGLPGNGARGGGAPLYLLVSVSLLIGNRGNGVTKGLFGKRVHPLQETSVTPRLRSGYVTASNRFVCRAASS